MQRSLPHQKPPAAHTAIVYQTGEEVPPIPKKSAARLSMQRKSWGPTTTLSNYMEHTKQEPGTRTITQCASEPRYDCSMQKTECIPCFLPASFSEIREILPVPEITTPSTDTSTQHSPHIPRWSPRWSRWPWPSIISPSPPATPVQGMSGQSTQMPPLSQMRSSDYDYRHYSV